MVHGEALCAWHILSAQLKQLLRIILLKSHSTRFCPRHALCCLKSQECARRSATLQSCMSVCFLSRVSSLFRVLAFISSPAPCPWHQAGQKEELDQSPAHSPSPRAVIHFCPHLSPFGSCHESLMLAPELL